jgi:hypothetical protein
MFNSCVEVRASQNSPSAASLHTTVSFELGIPRAVSRIRSEDSVASSVSEGAAPDDLPLRSELAAARFGQEGL